MPESEYNVLHKPSGTKVRVMSRQQGGLECTVMWPCGSIAAMSPNDLQFPTPSPKVVRAWAVMNQRNNSTGEPTICMTENGAAQWRGAFPIVPLIGIEGMEPELLTGCSQMHSVRPSDRIAIFRKQEGT